MRNPTMLIVLIVGVVLAGCGSDDTDTTSAAADDVGTTAASEPADDSATETTQSDGGEETSGSGQSRGTVTFGGETRAYVDLGNGVCTTDYHGTGVFHSRLISNDDSVETMTLALYPDGDPEELSSLVLISLEDSWLGNGELMEGSAVDSFDIDGNHAEGTATLISTSGEGTVSATFEPTCG